MPCRVVECVIEAKAFSILADETADIAGLEQLSLCARYVSHDLQIHEDFLQFVEVHDVTGNGLANSIIAGLTLFGVDVSFLRGQGYDGAASMTGKFRGAQAVIQQTNPLAIYSHYAAHNFNLVVSDACGVPLVRNSLGTMETVRTFFNTPKRKHVLNGILDSVDDVCIRSLKRVSVTRWMERLHSASNFTELYPYILSALEKIQEFENKDTSREAMALLATITKGDFVVTMLMLSQLFGLGEPVCRQLQRVDIDFGELINAADDLVEELTRLREDADSRFEVLFKEAQQLASKNSVEIKLPRITHRQTQRANPDVARDVEMNISVTMQCIMTMLVIYGKVKLCCMEL